MDTPSIEVMERW